MEQKTQLDKYEKEILTFFEKGEWIRVEDYKEKIKYYFEIASNTIKKVSK